MDFLDFITGLTPKKWDQVVFGGLLYWSGWLGLKALTLGKIRLAPFGEYLKSAQKSGIDWALFLHERGQRHLKAQTIMLAGAGFWILVVLGVYCLTH